MLSACRYFNSAISRHYDILQLYPELVVLVYQTKINGVLADLSLYVINNVETIHKEHGLPSKMSIIINNRVN